MSGCVARAPLLCLSFLTNNHWHLQLAVRALRLFNMAKKPRDEVPNPNSVSNRDIIQRLNFLYQASIYLNGVGAGSSQEDSGYGSTKNSSRRKNGKRSRQMSASDLSRSYIKDMKLVGQKALVRMQDFAVSSSMSARAYGS